MAGLFDDLAHWTDFGYAAGIHHRHTVRRFGDDAHIMGDEHHGGALIAGETLQQGDDLRLDGDVERGGGFVGNDEFGLGAEGEGDDHALAHAAGEFMRVAVDALGGGGDADAFQPFDGPRPGLGGVEGEVGGDGFDQLPSHGVERVQGGQRVLEDGADLLAADAAHIIVAQIVDAAAFEEDLAAGDAAGGFEQADDGRAGHGFAGTRFADDAQHLAGGDGEGDVVKRHQGAAAGGEFYAEVADFEEAHWSPPCGREARNCLTMGITAASGSGRHAANRPAG